MSVRTLVQRFVRNIQRSHGTYYVTIPKELVQELGWRERQKVIFKKEGKKLIVKDWK